jgi:hypothetical protein
MLDLTPFLLVVSRINRKESIVNLYDYIYVDFEKAISLYSQLTGGVVELRETQTEKGIAADNKRNYNFKVFKHDAGGITPG